jgi:hypothetical protein
MTAAYRDKELSWVFITFFVRHFIWICINYHWPRKTNTFVKRAFTLQDDEWEDNILELTTLDGFIKEGRSNILVYRMNAWGVCVFWRKQIPQFT